MTLDSLEIRAARVTEMVHGDILHERHRQQAHWTLSHDLEHEGWEWLGLIATYAAAGEFVKAAALCAAAEEMQRLKLEVTA